MRKDTVEAEGLGGFIQTDEISIKVCGELIEANLREELEIDDVSEGMREISARINYWAGIYSAAIAEKSQIDALYRAWRAKQVNSILSKEKGLAEWKVKARVDAMDYFMRYKNALVMAERNAKRLEWVVQSFVTKSGQLQSSGAQMRNEIGSQNIVTKTSTRGRSSKTTSHKDREERKKRVREKISGNT